MDMDTVYYLFAASLTVTAILAAIAIWAPRSLPLRITAVILTAVFVPLAYASLTTLLSPPKPVDFAWFERNAETAHVPPPPPPGHLTRATMPPDLIRDCACHRAGQA